MPVWVGLAAIALSGCGNKPSQSAGRVSDPLPAESTAVAPRAAAPAGRIPCPAFRSSRAGMLGSPEVDEASGLAASRRNPGVLWVHNDSGDEPRIFAMTVDGRHLGALVLVGAFARDYEDMAIGPGPDADVSYLYVGDIGDNLAQRDLITVYRVPEPSISAADFSATAMELRNVVALHMRYPDGAHDAEALLVDPKTGDLFVVTKAEGGVAAVYRNPAPHAANVRVELERVAMVPVGEGQLARDERITGGEISPAGDWVLFRTYESAIMWPWQSGQPAAIAFAAPGCRVATLEEEQGEAIAFSADGLGYFTVSEGDHPPIFHFAPR